MRFATTHEWAVVDGKIGKVGISEHAKKELGSIVYIQLPSVGQNVDAGDVVCVLESTKAASDVYSPLSGTIDSVNSDFLNDQSWIYTIVLSEPMEFERLLLSKDEYEKLITG